MRGVLRSDSSDTKEEDNRKKEVEKERDEVGMRED